MLFQPKFEWGKNLLHKTIQKPPNWLIPQFQNMITNKISTSWTKTLSQIKLNSANFFRETLKLHGIFLATKPRLNLPSGKKIKLYDKLHMHTDFHANRISFRFNEAMRIKN